MGLLLLRPLLLHALSPLGSGRSALPLSDALCTAGVLVVQGSVLLTLAGIVWARAPALCS